MNILNFIGRLYKQHPNFITMSYADTLGETTVKLDSIDEKVFDYMGIKYSKSEGVYIVSLESTPFENAKINFTFDGITGKFSDFPAQIRQKPNFQIENDHKYMLRYRTETGGTVYTDTFPLTDDPVLIHYDGSRECKARLIIYLYKWLLKRRHKMPVEVCLILHPDARENVDKSDWLVNCMGAEFIVI